MPTRRRRRRASPEWEGRPTITVAALPGRGLYARHLGHPEGVDGVHRMTVPTGGGAAPARPGRAVPGFDSAWLRDHLDAVDVVHVHGLPARPDLAALGEAVDVVKASGRPLVVTAYHLSDPTGGPLERYQAALDVLVPAADRVITLTPSAQEEITRRWGVGAAVLPHPHVVDFVRMRQQRPALRGPLLVGAHLGALRGPIPGAVMAEALAEAVAQVDGVRLLVQVNEQVIDSGSTSYAPAQVRRVRDAVASVGGTLRIGKPLSESQLWDHLFALDVSVVPGLYGSHSVWPEACHDLGTQVVLPAGSHAGSQRPCHTFDVTENGPDTATLAAALKAAAEQAAEHHERERAARRFGLGGAGNACTDPFADAPGLPPESLLPGLALGDEAAAAVEQGPQLPPLPWRADPLTRWQERVTLAEDLRKMYEQLTGIGAR